MFVLTYSSLFLSPFSPESEEVQVSSSAETAESETQTDKCEQELSPVEVEEKVVTPLEKDEEEPISSTIILLGKDEVDEDKETKNRHKRRPEKLKRCPPCSSSCSCASSFQEFVLQQCSASLIRQRSCQTYRKLNIPYIPTPTLQLAPPPSSQPQPQPHGAELDQAETEQASEQQPEREAAQSSDKSVHEPSVLEPSQSSSLPEPSSIQPTPDVETPKLSFEEPAKESEPEQSQDVSGAEKHVEPSAPLSSSAHVKPTTSVSADEGSAAPTEQRPEVDASEKETNIPIQTQEKTFQTPAVPSALLSPVEQVEPAVVPEIIPTSTEEPSSVTEPVPEPQASGSPSPLTDIKTEEQAEDVSTSAATSSPSVNPSPLTASASLSDIYAEPFNSTEQNGNLMHGSNQKESVFMRLNNRIKALEVNMSLSGRYLEQLSQR